MKQVFTRERIRPYIWASVIFFFLPFSHSLAQYSGHFLASFFNNVWHILFVIVLNFSLYEYAIPFVLRKRGHFIFNILLGLGMTAVYLFLYSLGAHGWRGIGIFLGIYTPLTGPRTICQLLEEQMAYSMGSVFIFGIVRHIYYYVRLKQSAQKLQIEKQEAELNYLRSQTNPHFLFNTLNNIYSLSRDKSDLAPESVMRLSKILRFMLYETGGEFIPIEQEIKIISDYIELEKLRYDASLQVNFVYTIEDMRQQLPPLLMIPLVENAFKHGVSETRINPMVDIHLSVFRKQLELIVKNSTGQPSNETQEKKRIGLSNLRRQLELLYTDYDLSTYQEADLFIARLKINLASHV